MHRSQPGPRTRAPARPVACPIISIDMMEISGWRKRRAAGKRALAAATAAAAAFGPLPPANPFAGPVGTSTMHGDTASSDSTPLRGPGENQVLARFQELGAACPT